MLVRNLVITVIIVTQTHTALPAAIMPMLHLLFWFSLAGLVYIYIGYPLAVWMAAKLRDRPVLRKSCNERVSIVVAARNESQRLRAKLDSLFASDGADRIAEVLIGSDGSTDQTLQVIDEYANERVRLVCFDERRGKPAVLNDLIPQCTSPVVVLTDARQLLDPFSLTRLLECFADPQVGVVSGELKFRSTSEDSATQTGVSTYWRYETFLRQCESRFRSVPGATGAFYAVRRELFRPLPQNTLLDDVVIPMQAIEQGYRCLLEPNAVAWDSPSQTVSAESVRKRRTIAGCAQLVVNQPRWLLPWRNPIWWEFVSHKLARLLSPILLAIALITNAMLAGHSLYMGLLVIQGLFYGSAAFALMRRPQPGSLRWLGISLMIVSLNAVTLAALWDALRGRYQTAWQKTS